jgi:hypothetical protein
MYHRDHKGDTEFHREKTNFTIAWLQQSGKNEFSTAPESGKWPGKYPHLRDTNDLKVGIQLN